MLHTAAEGGDREQGFCGSPVRLSPLRERRLHITAAATEPFNRDLQVRPSHGAVGCGVRSEDRAAAGHRHLLTGGRSGSEDCAELRVGLGIWLPGCLH